MSIRRQSSDIEKKEEKTRKLVQLDWCTCEHWIKQHHSGNVVSEMWLFLPFLLPLLESVYDYGYQHLDG